MVQSLNANVMVLALIVASMLGIAPAASADETEWLTAMSPRLELRVPDERSRIALLKTVRLEASRSGPDPQLVHSSRQHAITAEVSRQEFPKNDPRRAQLWSSHRTKNRLLVVRLELALRGNCEGP